MSQELDIIRLGLSMKTYFKKMGIIVGLSVGLVLAGAYLLMPVKYKSSAVITIPSRYFQQPVVEDIIPSSGDSSENRALRESLLKTALSREALEAIRAKFNLFPSVGNDAKEYEIVMQKFQHRFGIVSLGLTSFQIEYLGPTAEQTFEVTKETQRVIVEKILTLRHQKLLDLRDNLIGRIDNLSFNVKGVDVPVNTARPEVIQSELSQVQGFLASLKSRFSDEHPLVKTYKSRERLLTQWLTDKKMLPKSNGRVGKEKVEGLSGASFADVDRYSDLLKRLDRLNIVLEYESKNPESLVEVTTPALEPLSPVSPNYSLVILWGLLMGMFLSMIYVSMKRISERVVSPVAEWAVAHKIHYLGKVPDLHPQFKRNAGKVTSRMKESSTNHK